MNEPATLHEYRVRFPHPDGAHSEVQVHGTVDRIHKTITYELPDSTRATLDVVTARALQMILWESVYSSLEPSGPLLRVEKNTDSEWPAGPSTQEQGGETW